MRPGHSGWIALRARGVVEPERYGGEAPWNLYAHTSPVSVIVEDAPTGIGSDLTAMADYVRMLMEIYGRGGNLGPVNTGTNWWATAGKPSLSTRADFCLHSDSSVIHILG